MNYVEALQYIHSVSWKGSRPGLGRISELMARLGHPENGLRFLHVVGTNGKGSVCAMLASILHAAGYKTGLYTSPYLVDFRERMQIDGEMIPPEVLAALTEAAQPHIDAMADSPTEFERITAIALCWFAQEGCDVVVLEAGMGGEFDATNVIPSKELAVITNIGLDHTEYLGDTVERIAATKARIAKPGCACVCYPNTESVTAVVSEICAASLVPLFQPNFAEIRLKKESLDGQIFDYPPYSDLFLPLLGSHQLRNAAVALTAVDVLRRRNRRISDEAVRKGLATVRWPGRFEVVRRDPPLILDGGHNLQCIDALCAALDAVLPGMQFQVLTGVLADKDWPDMYRRLSPYAAEFRCVAPDNPRALPVEQLAAELSRYGKPVRTYVSVEAALQDALASGAPVLACGSLYLIGEIRKILFAHSENVC